MSAAGNAHARAFGFEFAVARAHPALPGHFPGRPIVPGVLLLDHVLTGVTTELERPVSVLQHVRFAAALLPEESAMVACVAAGDWVRFSVQTRRADNVVTLATGRVQLAHRQAPPANAESAGRSLRS